MKIDCNFTEIDPQRVCGAGIGEFFASSPNRYIADIVPVDEESCPCLGAGKTTKIIKQDVLPREVEKIIHHKKCFLMEALDCDARSQIKAMLNIANPECPLAKEVWRKFI